MGLKQPVGQKRLTNVAVVRHKQQGLRFEVACYRNTVLSWRSGVEKSLDNVLQSVTVYTNVSKGVLANKDDLLKAFGTKDEESILERGELQVSDKERKSEYETLYRDVVQVLVDKCVNPATGRPYPAGVLDRALRAVHFAVDPQRSAKHQALGDALPRLQQEFPIQRARMRFNLSLRQQDAPALRALLSQQSNCTVDSEDSSSRADHVTVTCTAEPGAYRVFEAFMRDTVRDGSGHVEVVALAVAEGSAGASGGWDETDAMPANPPLQRHTPPVPPATNELAPRLERLAVNPGARASAAPGGAAARPPDASSSGAVVYPRGSISGLPEEHASRRERFCELDQLQPGWTVELRQRQGASVVEAAFWGPDGTSFRSFADARRDALAASKDSAQ